METVGLHLILGGSEFKGKDAIGPRFLTGLLESVVPAKFDQIIAIDTGINYAGRAVLKRFSEGRKAEGLKPIEVHRFKWRDDFAAARNECLRYAKTDWWVWADHDDVIENPERIRAAIARATEDDGGFFCTYLYAFDEYGNPITRHDRERIFRTSVGWDWRGRIHEVTIPHASMTWQKCDDVIWVHKRGLEIKSDRNLPLLLAWHQDEPDNIRVWYYLGNQYFAEGSWEKAAVWYERVWRDTRASDIDRYASMTYAARAWRNCDQVQRAIRADMAAITEYPQWTDSYIGMCENFIRLKQWEKARAMGETALTKDPPPSQMFINHLDYTWRLQNDLAIACAGMGSTAEALACSERAAEFRPDPETLSNVAIFKERLEKEKALAIFDSGALNGTADAIALSLPDELRRERKARDVWVPNLLRNAYQGTQPRIVFFCGNSLETWNADSPHTKGIGGSETAVVEVAHRLAQEGWKPIVYNSPGDGEGTYDGVLYAHWERFRADRPHDVFVSWRLPEVIAEKPNAQERWLWLHDLHVGDRLTEEVADGYTKVLGVSPWHQRHLEALYPFLRSTDYVENGIDLARFDIPGVQRNRFRFVYASSPDRGLATLLKFWPYIIRMEPMAELHIFYGWESFLRTAELYSPDLYRHHQWIMELGKQKGVHWRGRVPQDELAKEMLGADMWAYPTSFLETFCITAVEAMAAGLQIVASKVGNIPSVVGDAGVLIPGYAGSIAYGRSFLELTYGLMSDITFRAEFAGKGPMRAKLFTWERAMDRWKGLLMEKVAA